MADSNLILLLQLINANADVDPLIRRGLRFLQISRMISDAVESGYIEEVEGKLLVTAKGHKLIKSYSSKGEIRRDGGWISYEDESRIDSIPINSPYLPGINNSYFKK